MANKSVTELAGIGEVRGRTLTRKGYGKAYVVLGQFLILKKDEDMFKDWLFEMCRADAKQQDDCYMCLREWCASFL